jgi:hypothetical protein
LWIPTLWIAVAHAPARSGLLVFTKLRSAKSKEEWLFYLPIFCAVTLPDGTSTHGLVMRCKIDGKWFYRRATAEEEADYESREAW